MGGIKQDTLEIRKADDEIRLRFSFLYRGQNIFARFMPTLSFSVLTQFLKGYNFKKDPLGLGRPLPVDDANFFSPAYMFQTIGVTYEPQSWVSQRLGLATKQTIVTVARYRSIYMLEPDESYRFELGLESRTVFDKDVVTHVRYKTSLGFFAAFNKVETPDMLWENYVKMKVNSWLNVNFELTLLFDHDVSTVVQLREIFAIGIAIDVI